MDFYERLTEDLKKAKQAAIEIANITEDCGTCNFDSMILNVDIDDRVLKSVKEAGLTAFLSDYNRGWYMFSVPVLSQGLCRTAQAEVMRDVMKECGYKTAVHYMID